MTTKFIWHFGQEAKASKIIRKALSKVTRQTKLLQKLALNSSFFLSKKGSYYFSKYFKGLAALKNLSLRFRDPFGFRSEESDPYEIFHTGFSQLSEALKRFSSLESLDLCFRDCFYVEDEALQSLAKGFRTHISLKTIAFSFSGCDNITDLGIFSLCKGLKNLVFLQKLTLNFSECFSTTNEGLLQMQKILKKLKNLQEVNLDLCYWTGVDLHSVHSMTQDLGTLPSFQRMTIRTHTFVCYFKEAGKPLRFI